MRMHSRSRTPPATSHRSVEHPNFSHFQMQWRGGVYELGLLYVPTAPFLRVSGVSAATRDHRQEGILDRKDVGNLGGKKTGKRYSERLPDSEYLGGSHSGFQTVYQSSRAASKSRQKLNDTADDGD
jgi:hypothetical protein